jgi:hypothetical protein
LPWFLASEWLTLAVAGDKRNMKHFVGETTESPMGRLRHETTSMACRGSDNVDREENCKLPTYDASALLGDRLLGSV